MPDERMIVKNLLFGDIDKLRSCVSNYVDLFYKKYDPSKSLDKSILLDFISDLHFKIHDFIIEAENDY